MEDANITDSLELKLPGVPITVPFDSLVPGVDASSLRAALGVASDGCTVHVRWARVGRRAMLLHIYDALAAAGAPVPCPARNDALAGWDDMHRVAVAPSVGGPLTVESGAGGRPVVLNNSFSPLLERSEDCVNHIWAVVTALRFPLEAFEKLHLNIATELFERFGRAAGDPGLPPVFVKSYRYRGVVAPLLVWYCIHEAEVVCMLQEFLHCRYGLLVPESRVWYWELLPSNVNMRTVGVNFHNAGILPSLRFILRHAIPTSRVGDPAVAQATAERLGARPAGRMHSEYGRGICALWLGDDVFFYMEQAVPAGDQTTTEVTVLDCRLPDNHRELPGWVADLIAEIAGLQTVFVHRTIDACLDTFSWLLVCGASCPHFSGNLGRRHCACCAPSTGRRSPCIGSPCSCVECRPPRRPNKRRTHKPGW